MRYLKSIREGFDSEYYKEISSDEFNPKVTYKNLGRYIPFERRYYTKLVELGFNHSDRLLGCCWGYFNKSNFFIYQREDDYFDVKVERISKFTFEYFRCDQFDGLMEFLKDRGVILR